jgi:hypothetical protein
MYTLIIDFTQLVTAPLETLSLIVGLAAIALAGYAIHVNSRQSSKKRDDE